MYIEIVVWKLNVRNHFMHCTFFIFTSYNDYKLFVLVWFRYFVCLKNMAYLSA